MKNLFEALEPRQRALWKPASADICEPLLESIRAGDVVMVKGSNGSRMGPLVKAMRGRFEAGSDASAREETAIENTAIENTAIEKTASEEDRNS